MTILQAIGEWVQAQEMGVLGVDLFLFERPSRPVTQITLAIEDGGPFDPYRPIAKPLLRCLVRGETAEDALELAEALCDLLHGRENFELADGWWCYYAMTRGAARLLPQSHPDGGRPGVTAECRVLMSVRRKE